MPNILITGANRGLGLGLVQAYAAAGWRVYACCREPAKAAELKALAAKGVSVHRLDVEDHASVDAAAAELKGTPIDVLFNVAGYYGKSRSPDPQGAQRFGDSDFEEWAKVFRINVSGPMKVAEAFVEHVAASAQKKIVTLSSTLGSIGANTSGNIYPYRASKAAVNAVMKSMAINLKARGIIAIPMHPGWVRTDMGGPNADIDVETSVTGMKKVVDGLTAADSGTFFVWDGSTLPW